MLLEGIKNYKMTGNQFIILCFLLLVLGSYTFSWFFEIDMIFISLVIALLYAIQDEEKGVML